MRLRILGPGPKLLGLKPAGLYLKEKLTDVKQGEFYIIVALAQKDVLKNLSRFIRNIRKNGKIKAIVGIDLGATGDDLDYLNKLFGSKNIFIYKNPKDGVFHPKVYILKNISKKKGIVIIGSSNLTKAGLFDNFEINIAIEFNLNGIQDRRNFKKFVDLFNDVAKQQSTRLLERNLLSTLKQIKILERKIKITSRTMKPPKLSRIFKGETHGWKSSEFKDKSIFLMTLSYNDVSGVRRGDKYIRIPVRAKDANPDFWGWKKFKPSKKAQHPERFIQVMYKGKRKKCRIYFVQRVCELRLVLPDIYTLGRKFEGSILKITKRRQTYYIDLITKSNKNFEKYLEWCTEKCPRGKAKLPKLWGYV